MSGTVALLLAVAAVLFAVDLALSVVTLSASALSRVALRRMNTESGNRLRFLEEFKMVPSEHRAAVHTLREASLLGAVALVAWAARAGGWPGGLLTGLVAGALFGVVLVEGMLARFLALQDPKMALRLAAGLVRAARVLTWPVLVPVRAAMRRRGNAPADDERDEDDDEDIEAFIEVGEREGILEKSEGEMVRGIVDLDQTLVREIMTPRVDVVMLPASATIPQARRSALEAGHSRFPVYGETVDHIAGILHVRDLLRAWDEGWREPGIGGLVRPPLFVPETRTVKEVLAEMRTRAHVALVVDEYGGFAGMVTLEDLLEEIVGEIRDEHERDEAPLRAEAGGAWLVSGLAHADELERLFGVDLGERDYDTVGGFVTAALGRVPGTGEKFASRGLAVEVVEADPKRVWRVRVRAADGRP
ncbi:MAG TPA: hemolysin family protein [Candidatus Polarisedimenticolaceae bacterium]|nr:hemolysin family protein [Candidatus Polarisedimenticolaceae bacterium]